MNSIKTLHMRTKAFARDNSLKSWWCILSTTLLLVVAATGTLLVWPLAARLFCCVLMALVIVRLFVIYHDHQHRAILPKSRFAEIYMRIYGMLVLCPSSIWRASHDYRHAHNSKLRSAFIGSYPIMTKEQYGKSSNGERFKYLFMRHPLTILFGYFFVFFLGMVIAPILRAPLKHYDCLLSLVLHITVIATIVVLFGW